MGSINLTTAQLKQVYEKAYKSKADAVEFPRRPLMLMLTELIMRRNGTWIEKHTPSDAVPLRIEIGDSE